MRSDEKFSLAVSLLVLLISLTPGVSGRARADDLSRGRELFDLCGQCHGAAGEGNQLYLAPAISGLEEWYLRAQLENFMKGKRGSHPDDVGGLRMVPMSMSLRGNEDVSAVAAYTASLPPAHPKPVLEGGDVVRGQQLFVICAACHGPKGEGNRAVNSPSLRHTSDWYLLRALEKYKSGVRGGNPINVNAVMMRGMATQLVDEQAMKDVVAYIMTLRDTQ